MKLENIWSFITRGKVSLQDASRDKSGRNEQTTGKTLPHLELTSNFPQLTIQTYHQKLYRRLDPSRQSARRDLFAPYFFIYPYS